MQNNFSFSTRIDAFINLGKAIEQYIADTTSWPKLDEAVSLSFYKNGWFDYDSVMQALQGIATLLEANQLQNIALKYPDISSPKLQKVVGLIMAGNIPLVGFHDVLCVLLVGHKCKIKLSSQDPLLLPVLLDKLCDLAPSFKDLIDLEARFLKEIDAVIATGSNNSSKYFNSYFAHIPSIIRHNRTSVAILTGNERKEELHALGNDIFQYYGLGCRNVSTLFVPVDYDFSDFFAAIIDFAKVADNKKYFNNYSYNRTVYLLNSLPFLDNNFLALKQDNQLSSPIGVLHYTSYANENDLQFILSDQKNNIQCIVGSGYVPFGQAQFPTFFDFADGVDTLDFLLKLQD